MSAAKILLGIADDHQIVIDGLSAAIRNFSHLQIVITGTSGDSVLAGMAQQPIDILLTDMMMPDMDGVQLAKAVRSRFPAVRIIALSMSGSGYQVHEMISNLQIEGYLLKQCGIDELVGAIETVFRGGSYFQPSIREELEKYIRLQGDKQHVRITTREREIIALMENDLSNKEIAMRLFISVRTVETHRKNILAKTGTNNVLSLVKWAYEHHILHKAT